MAAAAETKENADVVTGVDGAVLWWGGGSGAAAEMKEKDDVIPLSLVLSCALLCCAASELFEEMKENADAEAEVCGTWCPYMLTGSDVACSGCDAVLRPAVPLATTFIEAKRSEPPVLAAAADVGALPS